MTESQSVDSGTTIPTSLSERVLQHEEQVARARLECADTENKMPLMVWLNDLSNRYAEIGRANEALSAAKEAFSLTKLMLTLGHCTTRHLATSRFNMSKRRRELNQFNEAVQEVSEAVLLYRGWFSCHDDETRSLAIALDELAQLLAVLGRFSEVPPIQEEAITLLEQLAIDSPSERRQISMSLGHLAHTHARLGQHEEHLSTLIRRVAVEQSILLDEPADAATLIELARTYEELALAHLQYGDRTNAILSAVCAVDAGRTAAALSRGTERIDFAVWLERLVYSLHDSSRQDSVEELVGWLDEAISIFENTRDGLSKPELRAALRRTVFAEANAGGFFLTAGRLQCSAERAQRARSLLPRIDGEDAGRAELLERIEFIEANCGRPRPPYDLNDIGHKPQ